MESMEQLFIGILRGMFLHCAWMGDEIMKRKFSELTAYKLEVEVMDGIDSNHKVVVYKDSSIHFELSNKRYITNIKIAA